MTLHGAMTSIQTTPPDDEGKIDQMWANETSEVAHIDPQTENWKSAPLPLARIKKIMKSDEGVYQEMERQRLEQERIADGSEPPPPTAVTMATRFMIAGEAPILMGKACELMIKELTARSWRHTERNRRRTLQKQDICTGVSESEVYDFLIDIVPRGPPQPTPKGLPTVQHSDLIGVNVLGGAVGASAALVNNTGQGTEQAMTVSQAETRYAQLQEQLQGQYDAHQSSEQAEGADGAIQALQQNWGISESEHQINET